jgi:putative transposase
MTESLRYKPGAKALYRDRPCQIVRIVSASQVMIQHSDESVEVVGASSLEPVRSIRSDERRHEMLESLDPNDLNEARRRYGIIKSLLRQEGRPKADVRAVAKSQGISVATIYRWIAAYHGRRTLTDLAPRRRGRSMPKRLSAELEAIISNVITDKYLTSQRHSVVKVIEEVHRRCDAARLPRPTKTTIRVRVNEIPLEEKVRKREGVKAARDRFALIKDNFPCADKRLAIVQLDHMLLDIRVLDRIYRLPIGRPWLTLAIDVFSRVIVGYYLSLDYPNAFSVGLCLCHAMLPKDDELKQLGIRQRWDVWGKPDMFHTDNGKDFRSYLIEDACGKNDLPWDFRRPAVPHYGGHIERALGTVARKIHGLPGTTFSEWKARREYDSDAKATMTLDELRYWLLNYLLGEYHNSLHKGIGCPPMARWEESVVGSDRYVPAGIPDRIADPFQLRVDFLPFAHRTVQREGIVWDHIWYSSGVLADHVGQEKGGRRRKFKVRRDPTDLSKLYFYDEAAAGYVELPQRGAFRPVISLWDHRAATAWLRAQGVKKVDEDAIYRSHEDRLRIEAEAKLTTKRARRARAKSIEQSTHRAALTVKRPKPAKAQEVRPLGRAADANNRLTLVVDNQAPTTVAKSSTIFDFSDADITSGVEKW